MYINNRTEVNRLDGSENPTAKRSVGEELQRTAGQ